MLLFPHIKLNLGLHVERKRPDGYHDLSTCFVPVPGYTDALEAVPALPGEPASLSTSGQPIPGPVEDNLVWRAYQLLVERHNLGSLAIYLHKHVPTGTGLGAGSADAAFMLRLGNQIGNLGLDDDLLAAYALELGSDCPFFIYNRPLLASGRGEAFSPIELPQLQGLQLRIMLSSIHVSTREAFGGIVPRDARIGRNNSSLSQILAQPIETWRELLVNDFEPTVFAAHPILANIKEKLYADGALYAAMSGSGSAIFGYYPAGSFEEEVRIN